MAYKAFINILREENILCSQNKLKSTRKQHQIGKSSTVCTSEQKSEANPLVRCNPRG